MRGYAKLFVSRSFGSALTVQLLNKNCILDTLFFCVPCMDGISGLKKKEDEILVNDVDNLYVVC